MANTTEDIAKTIDEIAKGATDQAASTEVGATKTVALGGLIEANKAHMIIWMKPRPI